ncbi:MAG: DDE-type integrase/transposase/recombinase [Chloroflexi bacterium]|nr:DDE-type integrase/transposase/recombinase [Chloroflexota bacterium]
MRSMQSEIGKPDFAPLITQHLRSRRKGNACRSWYTDETYVRVSGKWCYLYRAIDKDGSSDATDSQVMTGL